MQKSELQEFEARRGNMSLPATVFLTKWSSCDVRLQRDLIRGLGNPHLDPHLAVRAAESLRVIYDSTARPRPGSPPPRAGKQRPCCPPAVSRRRPGQRRGGRDHLRGKGPVWPGPVEVAARHCVVDRFRRQAAGQLWSRDRLRVTDFESHSIFHQPASSTGKFTALRETVEADILISVAHGSRELEDRLSCDFKFRSNDDAEVTTSQLEAEFVALRTGEKGKCALPPTRISARPPTEKWTASTG